ncbi:Serine/threonine-protein phosphatase 2A regulatory subunit B'' subunit gamma [Thoreauomyces humboldtii]|nr:Serine/threonine-protein phosphatase 2A regulatory subunit B'' subunit gamma [Thoreauomyces humboldtii]
MKWQESLSEFLKTDERQVTQGGASLTSQSDSSIPSIKAAGIPKFFAKRSPRNSELARQIDRATYSSFVQDQRESLPTSEELDGLWELLQERTTGDDGDDDERRLTFKEFTDIRNELPRKFHVFFSPSIFLQLVADPGEDSLSIVQLYNYVLRKELGMYDLDYDSCLNEEDLQAYIADLMHSLNLESLAASFQKFYLCTASRKFAFFLDPMHRGSINIQTILLSPILTELYELREPELPKEFERTNWFSSYSSLRVYGQFLNLDADKNGMLSRKELGNYNGGSLTDVFLDRVFQECMTYHGEMDYRSFLDFVLAMENVQTAESMAYFFRALDIDGNGYLEGTTVMYFFKAVVDKMVSLGHEAIGIRDFKNEIFDMVNPAIEQRITLNDLIKSGVGGTVIKVLSDIEGFWAYEARENVDPNQK